MLTQRLSLGKYFGIGLYVHWSFSLVLAYAAFQVHDLGLISMAFVIFIVLCIFACVTLHEYGHALAARRFGIPTVDITLLPIGGVARLERMPRIPWQELIVAVAGPLVNVVIAAFLWAVLTFGFGVEIQWTEGQEVADTGAAMVESTSVVTEGQEITAPGQVAEAEEMDEMFALRHPSLLHFLSIMLGMNVILVLFNMIPAFPMDGGRVLRSLLAMVMNYRTATTFASRIGVLCAIGMVIFYFYSGSQNPFILLIAAFIGYAGLAEARQVDVAETVRGLYVRDVMIHNPPAILMDTQLRELTAIWKTFPIKAVPVVSAMKSVVGLLTLESLGKALADGLPESTTAGQIANHGWPTTKANEPLEDVVLSLKRGERLVPVVDDENQLVGMLDLDSIRHRKALVSTNSDAVEAPEAGHE